MNDNIKNESNNKNMKKDSKAGAVIKGYPKKEDPLKMARKNLRDLPDILKLPYVNAITEILNEDQGQYNKYRDYQPGRSGGTKKIPVELFMKIREKFHLSIDDLLYEDINEKNKYKKKIDATQVPYELFQGNYYLYTCKPKPDHEAEMLYGFICLYVDGSAANGNRENTDGFIKKSVLAKFSSKIDDLLELRNEIDNILALESKTFERIKHKVAKLTDYDYWEGEFQVANGVLALNIKRNLHNDVALILFPAEYKTNAYIGGLGLSNSTVSYDRAQQLPCTQRVLLSRHYLEMTDNYNVNELQKDMLCFENFSEKIAAEKGWQVPANSVYQRTKAFLKNDLNSLTEDEIINIVADNIRNICIQYLHEMRQPYVLLRTQDDKIAYKFIKSKKSNEDVE